MSELTSPLAPLQCGEGEQVQPELPEMPKPKSKYTFAETDRGVLIQRDGGLEVEVYYADTYICIGHRSRQGLYAYRDIVNAFAGWFADNLLSSASEKKSREAIEMIARALSKRFKPHWERMVNQIAPPEVSKLAKVMWSSILKDTWLVHEEQIYLPEYEYLLRDLLKYHACRVICAAWCRQQINNHEFPVLKDWRGLVAPTVPNKALNKTLDKMARGIRYEDVLRLSTMRLERPITDRLTLVFVLCAGGHHNYGIHERIVVQANAAQIKEASERYAPGDWVRNNSPVGTIDRLARWILDYPEPYGGDLVGLAQRSREWHDAGGHHHQTIDTSHELPKPDVDLGMLEGYGIRFLDTVGAVMSEGDSMHHCVGSYATKAAGGGCYLFHVDHNGEKATVEVDPLGNVLQACGPSNRRNKACDYGARRLAEAFSYEAKVASIRKEIAG